MTKRKKRYILSYVSLFAMLILQTTLINRITIFGISPSVVLVLAICFAMMNDVVPSAVFATVAGLLLDITGGRIFGFNALLMLYLSLGIVIFGQDFFRDTPKAAAMLVGAGTFLYELVFFLFTFTIFGSGHFFYALFRIILIECVYNSLWAFPIYLFVNKFLRIRSTHSLLD